MADILQNIFRNFNICWETGKDARLNLECHAGQVWINFHLNLSHASSSPPKHHPPRKPGPARLRRRARREEARAHVATENVANNATADSIANVAEIATTGTSETAVEVETPTPFPKT